jgi:hypothetical protein
MLPVVATPLPKMLPFKLLSLNDVADVAYFHTSHTFCYLFAVHDEPRPLGWMQSASAAQGSPAQKIQPLFAEPRDSALPICGSPLKTENSKLTNYLSIRICLLEEISFSIKIYLDCNHTYMVIVCPFDENLLTHINHELADNAGRKSDPS